MKNRLLISIITAFIIMLGWGIVSENTVNDISHNIVRLHIIANSNSDSDQRLKLKVRDRLLSENFEDIKYSLNEIKKVCKNEISENGYDYEVNAELGKFYFPSKTYENITLPAGQYNAVKITIGEGDGENWWCVMYPPLCYSNGAEGRLSDEEINMLKKSMKDDNYELIENDKIKIKPAFKIVEWWQEIRNLL